MGYRAYNKTTTLYLSKHRGVKTNKEMFTSAGAAKAAITREAKLGHIKVDDFAVADSTEFYDKIEKTEIVQNLMSKKDVVQRVNTPLCCDPSSETYWSM